MLNSKFYVYDQNIAFVALCNLTLPSINIQNLQLPVHPHVELWLDCHLSSTASH